jgi:hypothetical protein
MANTKSGSGSSEYFYPIRVVFIILTCLLLQVTQRRIILCTISLLCSRDSKRKFSLLSFFELTAQLDISEHDESVATLKEAIADAEANDRLLQGFVEQPICVKLRIHLFVIGLLIVANASCPG